MAPGRERWPEMTGEALTVVKSPAEADPGRGATKAAERLALEGGAAAELAVAEAGGCVGEADVG